MVVALFIIIILVGITVGIIAGAVKGTAMHIDRSKKAEEYGADISANLKHVSGLPIAAGVMVGLFCMKDKLTIRKDDQEIELAAEKLKAIDSVTGRDLQTQANGALAGGLLFGLTGAAIGALTASTTYLIITYESGGEQKYITLDLLSNTGTGKKVAEYYKGFTTEKAGKIEL